MASKYPRLGVARDPELEDALDRTRSLLDEDETRSAAAHVRALALRGAETLVEEDDDPVERARREFRKKHNVVRPATSDPRTFRGPRGEIDPNDPTPMTDALNWVRGKDRDY